MVHRNTVCAAGGCAVGVATLVTETDRVDSLNLTSVPENGDTAALDRLITTADLSVAVESEDAGRESTISGEGGARTSNEQRKNE